MHYLFILILGTRHIRQEGLSAFPYGKNGSTQWVVSIFWHSRYS